MSRPVIPSALIAAAVLALAACSSKEAAKPAAEAAAPAAPAAEAAAPAPAPITADASVIDLMKNTIAPTADALWNAVGSESTAAGTKDLAPSSDAEWAALRQKAQLLVDSAKAIIEDKRVVARPGQKLKDPPGPGDFTPEQAQAAIAKERAPFVAFATAMQGIGNDYIAAIDKKNVEAFTDIGGKLDEVCEACHTKYWYPNAQKPPGL
jgi:hypothetical protein